LRIAPEVEFHQGTKLTGFPSIQIPVEFSISEHQASCDILFNLALGQTAEDSTENVS
jgi:hypothetical protein